MSESRSSGRHFGHGGRAFLGDARGVAVRARVAPRRPHPHRPRGQPGGAVGSTRGSSSTTSGTTRTSSPCSPSSASSRSRATCRSRCRTAAPGSSTAAAARTASSPTGANLVRPAHYRLLAEILRFHRRARGLLDGQAGGGRATACARRVARARRRSRRTFAARFLYPMASAIWSTSLSETSGAFPARMLARFFDNHGLLQVIGNPKWRVVRGGSSSYIAPLTAPYRDRIVTRRRDQDGRPHGRTA